MKTVNEMTETELRDADVPWPKTEEELTGYISALVDRSHDYGTCVYAMSMAAVAAYYYVAKKLGVTGFQASCADLDFIKRTRGMKQGFRIVDFDKLLYPQYLDAEHFPSWNALIEQNKEQLADAARKRLAENSYANGAVVDHWKWIASLSPPKESASA